ncbi:MAG: PEGA domain-containing protein [Nannocystaceae bacterium]|nr:PEGA domain-containing protein [Nannocystaceae bacterium]
METLLDAGLNTREMASLACGATDATCLRAAATDAGTRYLLVVEVAVDDRDQHVSMRLVQGHSGEVAASTDGDCEICGVAGAADLLREQIGQIDRSIQTEAADTSTLIIQSTPPGASIVVDGESAGSTPTQLRLAAGQHTIVAQYKDHETTRRTITTVGGVHKDLSIALVPVEVRETNPKQTQRTIGWATLGLGLGGIGGGIALLAIHQRARSCSSDVLDVNGKCPDRLNTVAGGATLMSLGVIAVATSIALLVRSRAARPRGTARVVVRGLSMRF